MVVQFQFRGHKRATGRGALDELYAYLLTYEIAR